MTSQYSNHKPLSTERREIRVLHLRHGKWHDQISCRLKTVSLDESPIFEALSYVWGNPDDTSPIKLEDSAFHVTKNLDAALHRLRKKDDERVIWIDQLCINQADWGEKSKQVAFMPEIYKSCEEVILWLGEIGVVDELTVDDALAKDSKDKGITETGMDIVEQIGSGKHVHELPCFQVENETTLTTSPDYASGFEGLKLLASLAYWDRSWIVQENILPTKAMVLLGACSRPWTGILAAATYWSQHVLGCCRLLIDTLPIETRNRLLLFFNKIKNISAIAASRTSPSGTYLLDLLRSARSRKASDDRDKVFAFLGLITQWGSLAQVAPPKPDYTLTTVEVYAQTANYFINSMGGSLMALVGNHLRRATIPSWIMDWAAEDTSDYPYEVGWGEVFYNRYNASLGKPANSKRHGDSMLLLDGYLVDRVVAVGLPMEVHDWKSAVPILDSWLELTGVAKDGKQPYIAGGSIEKALWLTLIGNTSYNGKPMDNMATQYQDAVPEEYAIYELWKQEIRTAAEGQWMLSNETLSIQMVIPITARHRKLFITEKGFLGMGPLSARTGDDVHILLGSSLPFVTRAVDPPTGVGLEHSIKTYSLVGECYVHGIMDGEIVADAGSVKQPLAFC